MKKRKRKLNVQESRSNVQEPLVNLIDSSKQKHFLVIATVVFSLLSVIASANEQPFDTEEYRIGNLTTRAQKEEEKETARDVAQQHHGSQFKLFGASQRNQISTQPQPTSSAENETFNGHQSAIASLEDLLAVETTRLLTIGRQQATSSNGSQQAPYETTTTTISSSNPINRSSNALSDQGEPNERRFIKLFRPQPPPPNLLVFVPQSFGSSSSGSLRQHNTYQPVSSPVWQQPASGGGLATSNTAPSFGDRPVITTEAPSAWSSYSGFSLDGSNTNSSSNNNNSNQTALSKKKVSSDDESAKFLLVNNNPATTLQPKKQHQFPSLLSAQTSEDQFEQSLSQNASQNNSSTANMNWSQLLNQAAESNVLESLMVTNRSMVSLLCDTNDMLLRIKFRQAFNGIVMTNLDRSKVCRLVGNGSRYYEMKVSLRDCGTRQEMPRLFMNSILIKFQNPPMFDVANDEVKTIICSYPIRPRAPPPPTGLPERIIEPKQQDDPSPAKLVYYEPLILISGLLLLALALMGLTSAYMFRRNRRSRRRASSASFSSSRLYRNSPAQMANRLNLTPTLTQPPVIGLADTDDDGGARSDRSSIKGQREPSKRQEAPTSAYRWRTLSAGTRTTSETGNKTNIAVGQFIGSLPKSALKKDLGSNVSVVSLRGTGKSTFEQHSDSADSLATKNDRASVTTIEIPYAGNVPSRDPKARRLETPPLVPKKSHSLMKKFPPSTSNEGPTRRFSGGHSQASQAPRFGSLRATLTSPVEFKRLQEIARLFDEILIEKQDDKGLIVYNSRLIPSKYKTKIMDRMNELERRLAFSILNKDEVFRSLVVESIDRETFRRKLRNNPVYEDKFSQDAWQLLEEILLDSELSFEDTLSSDQETDESSPASSYLIAARPPAPPPPPPPPVARVGQRQIKSLIHATASESKMNQQDDSESIVAGFDTRQRELSNRQDSLNSPTSSIPESKGDQILVEEKSLTQITRRQEQVEPTLRVSQFNSTRMSRQVAGLAGTLINIDSVTNFTSSEDFSTYTRSSIEHRRFESTNQQAEDSLPYVDEDERVGSYEYAKETFKLSPKLGSNQTTTNRRLFSKRQPSITNNNNNDSLKDQSAWRINR